MRTDVTFVSNGLVPAGHLHPPAARAGHQLPAIVVIHPWDEVMERTAGLYARRLTEHGFAFQRAQAIKNAVRHLSTRNDVDPDRIGALGISTGGGHAVYAAISDQRVRAVGQSAPLASAACCATASAAQAPAAFRDLDARAGLLRTDEALGRPHRLERLVPRKSHLRQEHEYYCTARGAHLRSENAKEHHPMSERKKFAPPAIQEFAPKLAEVTDTVLFGDVWERPGLSPRDRSLVTVTALASLYRTDQLGFHLGRALENGVTKDELVEAITHLAFYAGWPNAMTAMTQLKEIVEKSGQSGD